MILQPKRLNYSDQAKCVFFQVKSVREASFEKADKTAKKISVTKQKEQKVRQLLEKNPICSVHD